MLPRQRADVDDVVGLQDRGLVVLDHDERVAEVAQADERVDQALVVALVQADRGFVEDVEHAHQTGADLGGEPDPLGLAPGQGAGGPGQRQVVEPHIDQEPQALADLLEEPLGDHLLAFGQLQGVDEGAGVADRQIGELGDVEPVDRDGERLGLEAGALAGSARDLAHELLELVALGVGFGLLVTTLDVGDHALVGGVVGALPSVAVLVADVDLLVGAVQQDLALRLGQPLERGVEIDVVRLAHGVEHAVPVLERGAGPGRERSLVDRQVLVGDDELGVDLEPRAEPVARGTGPVRRVEREVAGREFVEGDAVVGARELLAEGLELLAAVVGLDRDGGDALGELERGLDRIGDPPADVGLGDQAVDHDLDRVLVGLGQPDGFGQVADLAVDARPREALARQLGEQLAVLALAAPDDGRQHLEPGALGQLEHLVDDLLGRLAADGTPAVGAVRVAHPGVEHAEVVVDLGDRADGGARVPAGGLLVDGDGRREPFDEVDVGLLHLAQELPGVRRQRLHVPPLALGVDRVEGERGFPGAGQAREHDQLVAREVQRDVLEVVLTSTMDDEPLGAHTGASVEASADTTSGPILRAWTGTCARPLCTETSRRSSRSCWNPRSARSPT